MNIGIRIKRIREQLSSSGKKVSQSAFGESIGVSRDVIANIENGRVIPDQQTIMIVCNTYNVNRHWLETGEGEMFKSLEREAEIAMFFRSVGQPDGELDQFKHNLILALAKLDESEWEVIAGIAKMLAEASESNKKEG